MSTRTERLTISVRYLEGHDDPEAGTFHSAVQDPEHTDELLLWVEPREEEEEEEEEDAFITAKGYQVNLCGSRRALHELGCYLIALSRFQSPDTGYHDHFDGIPAPEGKHACDLIVHGPQRLAQDELLRPQSHE